MIRTIISILVTAVLLFGLAFYEAVYVQNTFEDFHLILEQLKRKAETGDASYSDGLAVREYWESEKKELHVWVSHNSLQEIDYQLDETIGFLFVAQYNDALPKIEVLLGLSENIPRNYALALGNVF